MDEGANFEAGRAAAKPRRPAKILDLRGETPVGAATGSAELPVRPPFHGEPDIGGLIAGLKDSRELTPRRSGEAIEQGGDGYALVLATLTRARLIRPEQVQIADDSVCVHLPGPDCMVKLPAAEFGGLASGWWGTAIVRAHRVLEQESGPVQPNSYESIAHLAWAASGNDAEVIDIEYAQAEASHNGKPGKHVGADRLHELTEHNAVLVRSRANTDRITFRDSKNQNGIVRRRGDMSRPPAGSADSWDYLGRIQPASWYEMASWHRSGGDSGEWARGFGHLWGVEHPPMSRRHIEIDGAQLSALFSTDRTVSPVRWPLPADFRHYNEDFGPVRVVVVDLSRTAR